MTWQRWDTGDDGQSLTSIDNNVEPPPGNICNINKNSQGMHREVSTDNYIIQI